MVKSTLLLCATLASVASGLQSCRWQNNGPTVNHGEWFNGATQRCWCNDGSWQRCTDPVKNCQSNDGKWFDHGAWRVTSTNRCQCNNGIWDSCEPIKEKCPFQGSLYNHGQWVTGPTQRCQCNNGNWKKCTDLQYPLKPSFSFSTRQEFRNQFRPKDFTFDLLGRKPNAQTNGGRIQAADVRDVPALFGEGVSFSLFTIEACGINLPHVHPRATEILYVIDGPKSPFLQTAFVEPNGGRTVVNKLKKGEMTFFPEGLLHYQQNLGCERVQYLSALNHEDPGVSTMTFAFASLPDNALQSSLGLGADDVSRLVQGLPTNPGEGQLECRKRCGIW